MKDPPTRPIRYLGNGDAGFGPGGPVPRHLRCKAKARAAAVQLRESLTARPAHRSFAYDAQAGGLSWFVSIPSQPSRLGGGGAAGGGPSH